MQTFNATSKAGKRALAFARAAERGDEAARDKAARMLAEHCTRHGYSVADVIALASQPDPTPAEAARRARTGEATGTSEAAHKAANERTAKATGQTGKPPKAAAPKAPKPAKPADKAKAAEAAARVKLIGELRTAVSALYNGPSLAVRSNPKRIAASVYGELFASPKHRTELSRLTVRDESGLALIIKRGDKAGGFDPVALNFDAGIFSRLCSVGFIVAGSGSVPFALSPDGLSHARKAVRAKRAA